MHEKRSKHSTKIQQIVNIIWISNELQTYCDLFTKLKYIKYQIKLIYIYIKTSKVFIFTDTLM